MARQSEISRWHLLFEIDYADLTKIFDIEENFLKEQKNILRQYHQEPNSWHHVDLALKRLNYHRNRLEKGLEKTLHEAAINVMQNILIRYKSFNKLDGEPVGRTGTLESLLKDHSRNVKVVIGKTKASLLIMNKFFLASNTKIPADAPEAATGEPYYILQNQWRTPFGPRYERFFILEVAGIYDQTGIAHEEDIDLVFNLVQSSIEEKLRLF